MNIVITGASKGIGFATCERFAKESEAHSFVLCSRSAEEITLAVERLKVLYPLHTYFGTACDVSDEQQVRSFAALCNEKFGAADLLVNNAGFGLFKPVTDLSASDFRSVLGTNLRGVFLLTRELLPPMREKKSGTIITIASLAGKNGFPGGTAYCASKFAVRGFMNCLFLDVRSDNIRCATVFPGSVDTAFFDTISRPNTTTKMLQPSEVAETVWLASRLPMGATASEIDIRPTNPKGT
jgi:NADP-dependent 3-hydroxy acid dehydrogenase YdfG